MPKFHFKIQPEIKGGEAPGEDVRVYGPRLQAGWKASGVFQSRPAAAQLTLVRTVPEKTGDLAFLRAAVASQVWNNRDGQDKQWPALLLTYDKQDGNTVKDVQTAELTRLVILRWSLSWSGQGAAGQQGVGFTETVDIQAWNQKRTSAEAQNQTEHVDLHKKP